MTDPNTDPAHLPVTGSNPPLMDRSSLQGTDGPKAGAKVIELPDDVDRVADPADTLAEGMKAIMEAERRAWAAPPVAAAGDAEPQPAETLDDIVAELRSCHPRDVYDVRTLADRIEAATRPDPDTIPVNRDHFHNLGVVASIAHDFAAAMAAAGLPQEPTEPEAQR